MRQDVFPMAQKLKFQQNSTVIYARKKKNKGLPGGWFSLEQEHFHARVSGFGYGDYIRLLDEYGNVWRGSAERGHENTVRYQFRDALGRSITGMSDSSGLVLRDECGRTWRGFVE
jgi:hypothetical protein